MTNKKKLSEKTYRVLETEGAHTVKSKENKNAIRGLEFKDKKLIGPVELVEVEPTTKKRYEDFSIGEQLIIDTADRLASKITDYLTEKAILSFDNWLNNRKKHHKKNQSTRKEPLLKRKTKAEELLEKQRLELQDMVQGQTMYVPTEFDVVYEEFQINMTSEEVQKELIDIFILEVIKAKKLWKISHANITDAKDKSITNQEIKVLIEKLTSPNVLDHINGLLNNNPKLLEDWEEMAMCDILGRNMNQNGAFVPIDSADLKKTLTIAC